VSVLDRLPPWSTTGVGSLPFTVPRAAARHAVRAYDLPFCPQLPRLEGDMVAEWLGADPGRCGGAPDRDRRLPRAWSDLVRELVRRPPPHGVVKLQATGPVTLAWALERGERHGLAREIADWLAANVGLQVRALAERGLDALVVVDEPALDLAGEPHPEDAWSPLRLLGAPWGLHVCCRVPWDAVERARPDVLSIDVAGVALDRRAALGLERLLAGGGRVAWGVLAAHRLEGVAEARRRIDAAAARLGVEDLGARSLLTPSCGTGRLSPGRERAVAAELTALRQALAPERVSRP
jgi:methionine synthase II (cobalamin-independent)